MRRTKPYNPPQIDICKTAEQCPAKTWQLDGVVVLGRSVYEHCSIVGSIASELISQFPKSFQSIFPEGSSLLAACHDVGKVSPTFYARLCLASQSNLEEAKKLCVETESEFDSSKLFNQESLWGGHPGTGFLSIRELTKDDSIAWVVGAHHGRFPSQVESFPASALAQSLGGDSWRKERENLIHRLEKEFKVSFPSNLSLYGRLLLAGLTTVSDWIGSGNLFDNPDHAWRPLIAESVKSAGFKRTEVKRNLAFGDIFKDVEGKSYKPSDVQEALSNLVTGPGTYILEAPMGTGKTEAAFFAAYQAIQHEKARGIYFALPTQITANKIYERFVSFLQSVSEQNDAPQLLHAKAEEFLDRANLSSGDAAPGGSWFAYRKRGILAPFAVGTIDQMLLAVMAVRYNTVRAFGLAGKVIIIDEVHSYDAYTNGLLLELLKLLKELHCTVIILSATLTRAARAQLLSGNSPEETDSPTQITSDICGDIQTVKFPSSETASVSLSFQTGQEGESRALDEVITRAERGEQVLWIENDVASSQRVFRLLRARTSEMNVECGLLHSRFTSHDRAKIEDYWVNLYGKEDHENRMKCGRILVGTQILEQSLDIDADFLVSRLAATDMVLQRLGRLWRHANTSRPASARREAWLLSPALEEARENPNKAFGISAKVYSPYFLYRTLEALSGRTSLLLPADIPTLLENTYEEREEDGTLAGAKNEYFEGKQKMERMAATQVTTLFSTGSSDDDSVSTRYMEEQSTEVLVVRSLSFNCTRESTEICLADNHALSIPWKKEIGAADLRDLARQVASSCVRVRMGQAKEFCTNSAKDCLGLSRVMWAGKEKDRLYIAVMQKDGSLATVSGIGKNFCYSELIGWEKVKDEKF